MDKGTHDWPVSWLDPSKSPELRLRDAWIANCCGDEICMTRRLEAALKVLYGKETHILYADGVERLEEIKSAAEQVVGEAMPLDRAPFSQSVSNGAIAKLAKVLGHAEPTNFSE